MKEYLEKVYSLSLCLWLTVTGRLEGVPGLDHCLPRQLRGDLDVVAGSCLQTIEPGAVLGVWVGLQQQVWAGINILIFNSFITKKIRHNPRQ